MPRPGYLLRSALVVFGILFLPLSILFAYKNWRHNWPNATALFVFSIAFLWFGLSRSEKSWVTAIDELDADDQ